MKTRLFTASLLCTVYLFAQAQSLQVIYDGKVVTEGEVITVDKIVDDEFADPFLPEMKGPFYVKNISSQSVSVMIKKPELLTALPLNAKEGFCWAMCYDESPATDDGIPVTIATGETTLSGRYASYRPEFGSKGSATIKYVFFLENNPEDKASVTYKFSYNEGGQGITNAKKVKNFDVYLQNKELKVNYALSSARSNESARIEVFSVTGIKMKSEKPIGTPETTINISSLPKGFYVCSLVVDGKSVASEKFVISK